MKKQNTLTTLQCVLTAAGTYGYLTNNLPVATIGLAVAPFLNGIAITTASRLEDYVSEHPNNKWNQSTLYEKIPKANQLLARMYVAGAAGITLGYAASKLL
jgi:hypothetical protein